MLNHDEPSAVVRIPFKIFDFNRRIHPVQDGAANHIGIPKLKFRIYVSVNTTVEFDQFIFYTFRKRHCTDRFLKLRIRSET